MVDVEIFVSHFKILHRNLNEEPGQERELQLRLKNVADVGFGKFPICRKSTLLSVITFQLMPKIGAYHFTILYQI